jgi:hypothetical protein
MVSLFLDEYNWFKAGIVIDNLSAQAFKSCAVWEGFVHAVGEKDYDIDLLVSSYTHGWSDRAKIQEYIPRIYSSLVLFDKLIIPVYKHSKDKAESISTHYFSFKRLFEEGCVELVDYPEAVWLDSNIDIALFRQNKSIIIHHAISNAIKGHGYFKGNEYFEKAYELLYQRMHQLDQLGKDYEDFLFYDMAIKYDTLYDEFMMILESYHDLEFLQKMGSKYLGLINCDRIQIGFTDRPYVDCPSPMIESAFRAYQIVLEEECTIPFPRTLRSAIELRKDQRVKDFREVIFCWSSALVKGDEQSESRFRREIIKAKKGLERISTYKKISRIMTFAAIPISIASILAGVPFGLALLPIGPIITIDSIDRETSYRWLLFGK